MDSKKRKSNRKSTPTKLQNGSTSGSVVTVELDTMTRLSVLQEIIEERLKTKTFANHEIYLQDIPLSSENSLYDQGVRVTGSVELSIQVESETTGKSGRLTIVEIAKNMTEEEIKTLGGKVHVSEENAQPSVSESKTKSDTKSLERIEEDLGIPSDPTRWTPEQVYLWMVSLAKGYNLDFSMIKKTGMNGKKICSLPIEDFFIRFPYGNIFWSHLMAKKLSNSNESNDSVEESALNLVIGERRLKNFTSARTQPKSQRITEISQSSRKTNFSSSRSHNNGQIQLWQFLLELLTDADERHVITWVGTEGEFKFLEPEKVAQKWGERKGKPAMNYEKLSRALRYYYDGDMISKVSGKRFEYKFVCNLKDILGYDAAELSTMVAECYERRKAKQTIAAYAYPNITGVIENGTFSPC